MFGLVSGDVRDGSKDICAVCGRTFDAIPVVDTTLSGLVIDIEVLKVVVKVDGASTQVPAEEGRMCREDGGDVDVPLPTEGNGHPGLPFVEMRDDGSAELPRKVLNTEGGKFFSPDSGTDENEGRSTSPRNHATT
jgi:hypothetical protein